MIPGSKVKLKAKAVPAAAVAGADGAPAPV